MIITMTSMIIITLFLFFHILSVVEKMGSKGKGKMDDLEGQYGHNEEPEGSIDSLENAFKEASEHFARQRR